MGRETNGKEESPESGIVGARTLGLRNVLCLIMTSGTKSHGQELTRYCHSLPPPPLFTVAWGIVVEPIHLNPFRNACNLSLILPGAPYLRSQWGAEDASTLQDWAL